jgi:hypothetical protein
LIVLMVALQIYFAVVVTLQTADRGFAGDSINDMKSSISQLEYRLIEKNREITREYAYSLGFQDVDDKLFVHRDSVKSLSLNE